MGYLGNADPKLLFPDNVRDDLIPNPPQTLFNLSQEVPGGYEGNVFVFKRKHSFIEVLFQTSELSFDNATTTIECNDSITSSILRSNLREGYFIRISDALNAQNNAIFQIVNLSYSDPNIVLTLNNPVVDEIGGAITLEISKDGFWEVLQPEVDYVITGFGPNLNKQIQLSESLNEEDVCYVIHKGSATYNFVPSSKSVGPEQLQENLRNFYVDRYEGDGVETVFELSQEPINTKSIMVTVDGVVLDGDDVMELPPFEGDWFLDSDPPSGDPRPVETKGNFLTFTNPPSLGSQIRVLHLGFSTISRRAALSEGQVGAVPPGSIGTNELSNSSVTNSKLAINSVANNNIQSNAVTGSKILLNNEENLRSRLNDNTTPFGILKINNVNDTILDSQNKVSVSVQGISTVNITSDKLEPAKAGVDLGDSLNRFEDLFLSGDADITGNINGVNINALSTLISTIETRLNNLNNNRSSYDGLTPPGVLCAYAGSTAPSGWLLCDGQLLDTALYPELFSSIGYSYGGSGSNFRIPDMRQRFVLGKGDSGEGSTLNAKGGPAVTGSSLSIGHIHGISHTHNITSSGTVPSHTHALSGTDATATATDEGHRHSIAGHFHGMDHVHYIEPHHHEMVGNFNIRIPGAFGGGISAGVPPQFESAATPLSSRVLFSNNVGATPFDLILSGSLIDNTKTQTRRWFTFSNLPGESNAARAGSGTQNGSQVIDSLGGGLKTNRPVRITDPGTGAPVRSTTDGALPGTLSAVANTNNYITLSGNVASQGSAIVNSTGSTSSISSSNSGESSPPYITTNWIIKV
jgi:microcystin-dependent protein